MRSFKPYPNERDSVEQTRERCKKPCNFEQKIPMKILSHYPLVLPSKKNSWSSKFCKIFSHQKEPLVNAPQKKKKGERKAKEAGRRESKSEILLSAHARTLKAVIWHREQKLVRCSTCKQRFGQFGFFSARQRPKNGLTRFKRHFLAKCPGVNGLNIIINLFPWHCIGHVNNIL